MEKITQVIYEISQEELDSMIRKELKTLPSTATVEFLVSGYDKVRVRVIEVVASSSEKLGGGSKSWFEAPHPFGLK